MVRFLSVVFALFGVALLFLASRIAARSAYPQDCVVPPCAEIPLPTWLAFSLAALFVVGGVVALYVAVKAFAWRRPPPTDSISGDE